MSKPDYRQNITYSNPCPNCNRVVARTFREKETVGNKLRWVRCDDCERPISCENTKANESQ